MTLMEMGQLLGNFGEFFGAIAVVITLVYLAVQVGQSKAATELNTTALQSANYAAWNQASSSWGDFVARHSSILCAISAKSALDELTPDERFVFVGLAVKSLNQGQAAFLHHQAGSLPDEVFEAHMTGVASQFEEQPVFRDIWPTIRANFAHSFCDYMERKVEEVRSAD